MLTSLRIRNVSLLVFAAAIPTLTKGLEPAPQDVPRAVRELQSADAAKRLIALQQMMDDAGSAKAALPLLVKELAVENSVNRQAALMAIGQLGAEAATAVAAIQPLLGSAEPRVRLRALIALGEIGSAAQSAVGLIEPFTKADDRFDRLIAAWSLWRIDHGNPQRAAALVPLEIEALGSDSDRVASTAMQTLVEIGPTAGGAIVQAWTKANSSTRARMASVLAQLRFAAGAAPLREATQDQAAGLRRAAAMALGDIGAEPDKTVPTLARLLDDAEPTVRTAAADALRKFGAAAQPAADRLISMLKNDDPAVRRAALAAAQALELPPGAVVDRMAPLLESASPSEVQHILAALADAGQAAVEPLTKALSNPRAAYWALLVLEEIGPEARSVVSQVVPHLQSQDLQVRRAAVSCLAAIGPDSKTAVPELTKLLSDPEPAIADTAAYALGRIGPSAVKAVDALQSGLKQGGNGFGSSIRVWALASIQPQDAEARKRAVARLVEAVKNENPRVRVAAARALVDIAPDQADTRAALIQLLNDAEPAVVGAAQQEFARLGPAAVADLVQALSAPGSRIDVLLATLTELGPMAKAAAPQVAKLLSDDRAETRGEALFALASLGADAAAQLGAVVACLADDSEDVRMAAAYALGRMGPAAAKAVPQLRQGMTSESAATRGVSAWALALIAPQDPAVVAESAPVLIDALSNPSPMVRKEALAAIGQGQMKTFVLSRRSLVAVVERLSLEDSDPTVRQAATQLLKKQP